MTPPGTSSAESRVARAVDGARGGMAAALAPARVSPCWAPSCGAGFRPTANVRRDDHKWRHVDGGLHRSGAPAGRRCERLQTEMRARGLEGLPAVQRTEHPVRRPALGDADLEKHDLRPLRTRPGRGEADPVRAPELGAPVPASRPRCGRSTAWEFYDDTETHAATFAKETIGALRESGSVERLASTGLGTPAIWPLRGKGSR